MGTSAIIGIPSLITSGLLFNLDASNPSSYPGTGTTWTDTQGDNDATINYNATKKV